MRSVDALGAAQRRTARPAALPVSLATIESTAELERLAPSWDELVHAMPRPSPFLLHGWLVEWWRHYGGEGELAIHVAYRGDRLVGALPLAIRRRRGLRIAEFVGGTWATLADLLLAPGEGPSVARLLAERAASGDHDFASLFGLPGSSRLEAALPPGSLRTVERLACPVLDLTDGWEAVYRARISSKARSERRRRMRQLAKVGRVETKVVRAREELRPALEEAFAVHELRWRGRPDPTGFVTPTGRRFHRAAILRLAESDVPRLALIRVDGRAIGFALCLQLPGRSYGVTMGFDPAYGRYGPGIEAKYLTFECAASEGVTRVELLGADAPHKRRLTDRLEPVHQGIGLPRTARGRGAAAALAAGIAVRRTLKRSETARRVHARLRRPARG
ncbi:MAG TPA: GNAT family N-acetyltransferase [Gaiellaceae bacterium]|nr:GNAT family N-acetyltransferase [Gaiellaceae bacterium]